MRGVLLIRIIVARGNGRRKTEDEKGSGFLTPDPRPLTPTS